MEENDRYGTFKLKSFLAIIEFKHVASSSIVGFRLHCTQIVLQRVQCGF